MGLEIKSKSSVTNKEIDLSQFVVGVKCLAFHGPLLYEAKILRIWDPVGSKLVLDNNNNSSSGSSNSSGSGGGSSSNNSSTKRHDPSDLYPPESLRDQYNFFIHYQGWKATWDEWIGVDRIREYNEENVELKKRLIQEAKDSQKPKNQHEHNSNSNSSGSGGGGSSISNRKRKSGSDSNLNNKNTESSGNNNNGGSGSNNKRRNVEYGSETSTASSSSTGKNNSSSSSHNGFNSKHGNSNTNQDNKNNRNNNNGSASPSSNSSSSLTSNRDDSNHWNYGPSKLVLHIPIKLKAKLVDDWELITKDKRILTLPSKMTINQMLSTYKKQTMKQNMTLVEQCQLSEFLSGLIDYFECSLSRLLLYRLERLQYETLLKQYRERNEKMIKSDIYGPLHLLRLITILPELISATTMDSQSCQLIIRQCERLLIWMTIHIDSVFPTLNPREDSNVLLNNEEGYDNTSSQYEGVALGL